MRKTKDYLILHICIMIFSFTSVFAKFAANRYNIGGFKDPQFCLFAFIMLSICIIYAYFWQKAIKNIELHVAYANKSAYLIWGQIWAAVIFEESLSLRNIIGLATVLTGVIVVAYYTRYTEEKE